MNKKEVENKVKEVLVSKLKHDEIAVAKAQDIARGVLDELSSYDEGQDCIAVLKTVSEKYEELGVISQEMEGERAEALVHEIADMMSDLMHAGKLDEAYLLSQKVASSLSDDAKTDAALVDELQHLRDGDIEDAVEATADSGVQAAA